MDSDGFTVQGRRRGGATRESARERGSASFYRDNARYAGTVDEFSRDHARSYGHQEGLREDGSHSGPGLPGFPRGSERERLHDNYSRYTRPRDDARNGYNTSQRAAQREFDGMTTDEVDYYTEHTGGLRPDQHERLEPRAGRFADVTYKNATGREDFLKSHPHGYHTLADQNKHYGYAANAYDEYEIAKGHQEHHSTHRSYKGDARRDKYGRPMSRGRY